MPSGDLITRNYLNFLGVDFSDYKVSLFRSPDSKNMWKNYKSLGKRIETRPDIAEFKEMTNALYGLFFYTYATQKHMIIHDGTSLFDYNMDTKQTKTIKAQGMNPKRTLFFVYDEILYIKDGLNYLEYDGTTCKEVEGFIPTTSISRKPQGGGVDYQEVNMLTGYRKNSFVADGSETTYKLDVPSYESGTVSCWINGVHTSSFTESAATGEVVFDTAPTTPDTDGEDNVVIQFSKTISGYRNRINKCTLLTVFDNRVFFSGNQDYPNVVWYSELNNPRYCSDMNYSAEGADTSNVKALIAGNNALWVFKEPSQSNTTVFYHTPSIDAEEGKIYPSTHSSISKGCVSTGINFNDDIVMFSDSGMEGITGDVTTEQVLGHRSSLIDGKLLQETNYKDPILVEWQGYLLVFVGSHCYLADSRQKFQNVASMEYEWYYWEFSGTITAAIVDNDILYLCIGNKIYTLTKTDSETIESYWTTCRDDLDAPNFQKITNKRGAIAELQGEVSVHVKTDSNAWDYIDQYTATDKTYVVPRIKKKKWKDIQYKFSSNKPFSLYGFTIQTYVGSFVKR